MLPNRTVELANVIAEPIDLRIRLGLKLIYSGDDLFAELAIIGAVEEYPPQRS